MNMCYFPHLFVPFLICLFLLSSTSMGASGSNSNETDRLALLAFKGKVTSDPLGMMRHWNNSLHFCEWHGVVCSPRHERVSQLNLQSLKLGGSISPHVGNLSFLRLLHLQNNSFSREIPPEVGRLRRLRVLDLSNNSLGGEIPLNLSFCSELTTLILESNNLRGEIPLQLGSLSRLQHFGASYNHLTGAIPSSLGNLTFLEDLYLVYNKLGGRIPTTLGSLSNLRKLAIAKNYLSGQVPYSTFNLTSLELIEVSFNQLGGQLPTNMFHTLPNLQILDTGNNQFAGPIPSSLSNASNLQSFQIAGNKHSGKVPSLQRLNMLNEFNVNANQLGSGKDGAQDDDLGFLCSLSNATTNFQILEISKNVFGGMLPGCIANLSSNLVAFTIYKNYISGSIPAGIDNLSGLQVLIVSHNPLTGTIPPTIGNLENLFILSMQNNNFSGPIPSSFGKLSKLMKLFLDSNNLEGTIPLSLQNCTSLDSLGLDQNNLTGFIPPQVLTIPSLTIIFSASHNQLIGPLPKEVGKLNHLNKLDFSSNRLSGTIPDSLVDCLSLQYLYLDENNFQGPIPSSLGSMKGLQMLSLSSNNLSGQIPDTLASLDLIMLNLSFNNLQGVVPNKGVFKNTSVVSLKGNNELCGGIPAFHLPDCSSNIPTRKKKKLSTTRKVAISVVGGLASLALLILFLFVFGLRWKRRKNQKALVVSPTVNQPPQFVSYGDLYRATDGFSEEKLVGIGNFGHVYRGIMGEGGQVVAIKVLNLKQHGASKSFVAECEALRNIRHRNLVKLLTVCAGVDYQGNEFKALVYEFMPNGSLDDWLHQPTPREVEAELEQGGPSRKLGILERLSIATDVASLLEYVHHEFGTPLVHSDIKPSNILLDGDLCGHVSDFGLAKFLLDKGVILRSSIHPSSSTGVRGTIGYAPPEYGLGSEVSTQGDVYSYGILVLEMFTGKRPTHEMFKEGLSLHLYAKMALSNGVIDILDPVLHDLFETEDRVLNPMRSVRVMDSLGSVIEIGVACSNESPTERMNIGTASKKLHKIRESLSRGRN